MDGAQVTFGRRGVDPTHIPLPNGYAAHGPDHPPAGPPASPGIHHVSSALPSIPVTPSVVVNRSLSKMLLVLAAVCAVVLLTAGSPKHSADLPYWMRHDGQSHARDYAYTLTIYLCVALLVILPTLRRPIALQLFDDHFVYLPVIGAPRSIRWADLDEVSCSMWTKYIRIKYDGGRKVFLGKAGLDRPAREVVDLLENARVSAGSRRMQIPSREIAQEYLFPGH